jgi:hypothetical protein
LVHGGNQPSPPHSPFPCAKPGVRCTARAPDLPA